MKITVDNVKPFLRWAGGKRWLASVFSPLLKKRLKGVYREPFLGGGASFFALRPKRAILSDINEDLIITYTIVRDQPDDLIKSVKDLPVNKNTYLMIRQSEPKDLFDRAVRFLYLNRTCYGGLYRTNFKGRFNVPYGGGDRTPEPLWRDGLLKQAANILNGSDIHLIAFDFENNLKEATSGDIIYCDPTYRAQSRTQFDRYGPQIFGWKDQIRLAQLTRLAYNRGALIIISNTCHPAIDALYPDAYTFKFKRKKAIGRVTNNHNGAFEYLIILDPEKCFSDWKILGNFYN